MTGKLLARAGIAALTLAGASAAVAQLSGTSYIEGTIDYVFDRSWDDAIWRQPILDDIKRKQAAQGRAGGAAAGTSTFRPGTRTVLDRVPPEKKQEVTQLLAVCDKLYSGAMAKMGVPAAALNDVASSTAFFMSMNHHVYWDGQPDAPAGAQPAHVQYLGARLRERYAAKGQLAGKSDADKQRAHDGMVLAGCVPMLQYTRAKKAGNEAARRAARDQAASHLARIGLGPTSLDFRPDGTVAVTPAKARPAGGG